jgi:hypothetical protein
MDGKIKCPNIVFLCENSVKYYFYDYLVNICQILNADILFYDKNNINEIIKKNLNLRKIFVFMQYIHEYINKSALQFEIYFVINTEQYTHTLNNQLNNDNHLIDYSKENIRYAQKYLEPKKYIYFPYLINNNEIYNFKKIYDVCVVGNINDRRIKIIDQLTKYGINVTIINNKFGKIRDEILMKHKILLNIHNSDDYQIYESMRCDRCLFNNMIIISEKSIYIKLNKLRNFVIFKKYDNLAYTVIKIINNYDYYYNCIFETSKYKLFIKKYEKFTNNIYYNFNSNILKNKFTINNKFNIKKIPKITDTKFGFIIVRHVNSYITNLYWQECYNCIRKNYSNTIIIVDDKSDMYYLKSNLKMHNCIIINSEYHKRGEILGYYYYYKLKPFDKAIIIHDSVFIKKYIDFSVYNLPSFLWSFKNHEYDDLMTYKLIEKFDNHTEITKIFNDKNTWEGCYGVMSLITWDIINIINLKYNFFDVILKNVISRDDRKMIERIFACVCYLTTKMNPQISILGDIHDYCIWGVTWSNYKKHKFVHLSVIKVWTGR